MILFWTGSDVYYQNNYPKYGGWKFKIRVFFERIIVRLFEPFIQGHYIVSDHLIPELSSHVKKSIRVRRDFPDVLEKYPKEKHESVNVLYYRPKKKNQKFIDWLYGYDVILLVKSLYPEYNFIEVDGTSDMSKIYPIVDLYLRPNRHDGYPKMVMECEKNDIPYYWSKKNPSVTVIKGIIRCQPWQ